MGILDSILGPLLGLDPLLVVLGVSFAIALLINLVYKLMTDQHLMKSLKDKMKEQQQKMKEHRDNPQKVMEMQREAMDTNLKYMMHSLRPTLVTFIPIIIIFGWMNANFAYEPIQPGQEFSVSINTEIGSENREILLVVPPGLEATSSLSQKVKNNQATWTLKGQEGEYILEFRLPEKVYSKEVMITNKQQYTPASTPLSENGLKDITINYQKLVTLNLFGWKLGWLATYILASIVFSLSIRKLMGLH